MEFLLLHIYNNSNKKLENLQEVVKMKKKILPWAIIAAAVAMLWAYEGEDSESAQ